MTEPSRDQLVERIGEAIKKVAADPADLTVVELDAMSEYFGLDGLYVDDARRLAEVVIGAVQVALSNACYWRDRARQELDEARRETATANERARRRSRTVHELHERLAAFAFGLEFERQQAIEQERIRQLRAKDRMGAYLALIGDRMGLVVTTVSKPEVDDRE